MIAVLWFTSIYLINRAWGPKQTTADIAGYLFYLFVITLFCIALGVM